jgi:hypothetical protein
MMKSERIEIYKQALIAKKITRAEYEAFLDAIDALYVPAPVLTASEIKR